MCNHETALSGRRTRTTVVRPHPAYVIGPILAGGLRPTPGSTSAKPWANRADSRTWTAPLLSAQRAAATGFTVTRGSGGGIGARPGRRQHGGQTAVTCECRGASVLGRSSGQAEVRGRKPRSSPWSSSLVESAWSLNATVPAGVACIAQPPSGKAIPGNRNGKPNVPCPARHRSGVQRVSAGLARGGRPGRVLNPVPGMKSGRRAPRAGCSSDVTGRPPSPPRFRRPGLRRLTGPVTSPHVGEPDRRPGRGRPRC